MALLMIVYLVIGLNGDEGAFDDVIGLNGDEVAFDNGSLRPWL